MRAAFGNKTDHALLYLGLVSKPLSIKSFSEISSWFFEEGLIITITGGKGKTTLLFFGCSLFAFPIFTHNILVTDQQSHHYHRNRTNQSHRGAS